MNIKDYVKKYNFPYDKVKSDFDTDFNLLYESEKKWLGNLEDKLDFLEKTKKESNQDLENNKKALNRVIEFLKDSKKSFSVDNTEDLSIFVNKIDKIVKLNNWIGNFKEGTFDDNGNKLILHEFFNLIKDSKNLQSFNFPLKKSLKQHLPHIYSVIKHCQNPVKNPIYYKYWKNILREVLSKNDDYDSMCAFYKSFPSSNRHLNFATYLGTIGIQIAKNIKSSGLTIKKDSKEYNYLTKDVINIKRYNSILDDNLSSATINLSSRKSIYESLRLKMENVGFEFETEQKPHRQNRDETELKFIHPRLVEKLEKDGYKLRATKFYIKPLSDESNCEIGFVTGKSSPIVSKQLFGQSNSVDSYDNTPAWTNKDNDTALDELLKSISNFLNTPENDMSFPLNTILYGPPGTGKTYNSINYAVGIIEDKSLEELKQEDRPELRKRYDDYVEKGQIVFSTFHQSMSYEDFIEGIKPVLTNEINESGEEANTDIRYEIRSGIFKELVEKSKDTSTILEKASDSLFIDKKYFNENINKISLGNSQSPEDNEIYEYCIKNSCIALGWGEGKDYTGVKSKSDVREIFESVDGHALKPTFNIDAMWRFIVWMKEGQLVFVPNGMKKLKAIGIVSGDYFFDPEAPIRYSQFRKVDWLYIDLDISIKSIYPRYFSQQSIYQILGKEIDQSLFSKDVVSRRTSDKYVMIIDEINRGNVSQIFGELITLIEEDKRAGRKEALKIKLPYSKEDFSVPENIHILGTMNTADRSVEALDSALRRRFSFVEMPSKPALLKTSGNKGSIGDIDLVKLLKTINLRISKLIDSDHAIGHSYFFKVTTKQGLITVFKDKVIPLLEEYFFGDLGKLGLILGKSFIKESDASQNIRMKTFNGYGGNYSDDMNEKKVFKITSSNDWDFKDIYID